MNPYALIILVALLLRFGLAVLADALNARVPRCEVPPEMADRLDAGWLRRAREYLTVNTRFDFWESLFGLLLLLAFWGAGGFNALDLWLRGFGFGPVLTGLLFIGLLLLGNSLLNLPFSIYHTFVIEARFGFNRTTPRLFAVDRVKGLLLALVLGVPLGAGMLWFFEHAGAWAWLYCWLGVTAFTLFIQFLAPVLILPLFNAYTPLEDGELKTAILELARQAAFPLAGVCIMDGSKRSNKANAFFTGFGRFKRIALFDTLTRTLTVPELVGVLAHEIGHFKRHHILQRLLLGMAHTGVLFFLLSLFLTQRGLFDAFRMQHLSVYAGLLFFGILYTPVEMVLDFLVNHLSRRQEYEADRFAQQLTGDPAPLISALKKLSVSSLSDLTPHPFYVGLHYSHPPVLERLRALTPPARLEK